MDRFLRASSSGVKGDLDSLILRLIVPCIEGLSFEATTYDVLTIGYIGVCFDGGSLVNVHVAKLLLLSEHASLVLSDFGLVACNVVPVDL